MKGIGDQVIKQWDRREIHSINFVIHLYLIFRSLESIIIDTGWRPSSFVNIFFSRTTGLICTKCGMQHLQGTETRNCKFHDPTPTPTRGNLGVKGVKLMYFMKKSSSLLPGKHQAKQAYSNNDQGRVYQNRKFHDPRGWGFLC